MEGIVRVIRGRVGVERMGMIWETDEDDEERMLDRTRDNIGFGKVQYKFLFNQSFFPSLVATPTTRPSVHNTARECMV